MLLDDAGLRIDSCPAGDASGAYQRFAFDDAGKPIFLDADGTPSTRTSAIGPIRWMAPESLWEPSTSLFHGSGCVYSPPLGAVVSKVKHLSDKEFRDKHKKTGHVTLMK